MMRCDCVSDLGDFQQFKPDMYKLPYDFDFASYAKMIVPVLEA